MTSLATIPQGAQVEAHFLAKEDGVVAGIALAEMVFRQVDPSLEVVLLLCLCVFRCLLLNFFFFW